jgi:hypothetical protein
MIFWVISLFLLVTARLLVGYDLVVWVLLASQLSLLAKEVRRKQVSGVGGFIFLYVLFFGMRPLYLFLENDTANLTRFFLIKVGSYEIGDAMWWATLALFCFSVGASAAPSLHKKWLSRRIRRANSSAPAVMPTLQMCVIAVVMQVLTLPFMLYLASMKRTVYHSGLGAYFYDLPMPLQAVHVFAFALVVVRFWRHRTLDTGLLLGVSVVLLLFYTFLMRDVSSFRGFYLSGFMIAGLAVLHQVKPRVGYAWLILPIILLQPLFAHLGAERGKTNEELLEEGILGDTGVEESFLGSYWHFYNGAKDMNIFDTFVAAKQSEPQFYPLAWSWLYVPLHWVPRKLWSGKPERGSTQDMSFTRGAPLSPGIAGFFLRDGGLLWMLASMALLGYFVSLLDYYVMSMPRSALRSSLIGVVVVNGMFLSRLFLWQYFYQMLYTVVVVTALAWWMRRMPKQKRRPSAERLGRQGALLSPLQQETVGEGQEMTGR